jgi:cytochrome P450
MIDFDPFSEAYFDDPLSVYRSLREEAPAYYHEGLDCYFLSRFEDIWAAVGSGDFSHRMGTNSQDLLVGKMPDRALSSMVPPGHTALRKALFRHFSPAATQRLEPYVREVVSGLLEQARASGEVDANVGLGRRLSARVAFRLIGLPEQDADEAAAQVGTAFDRSAGVKGPTETALEAQRSLHAYLQEALEERMGGADGEALIDTLIAFELEGKKLPPQEILANLYLMVVGGTETLPKVFAGGVYQLWRHPDQRAELAKNPSLIPDAFWEILRYEMPTLMLGAVAEVPTTIGDGVAIEPGQKVMHLWVSANRDDREFEEPDRFDIHRCAPRILTFNHGRHRCLGAHIAQMEGRILLEGLLAAAPRYEIDEARGVRIRSEFFRGFDTLPILLGEPS